MTTLKMIQVEQYENYSSSFLRKLLVKKKFTTRRLTIHWLKYQKL